MPKGRCGGIYMGSNFSEDFHYARILGIFLELEEKLILGV